MGYYYAMVVLLGIVVMLAWGAGNYVAARAGKWFDSYLANLLFQIGGLLLTSIILLFTGTELALFSDDSAQIFLLGSLFAIAFIGYIAALQKAQIGAVAALSNGYLFVTLGILIATGYEPSIYEVIGMIGIVIGAGFINYSNFNGKTTFIDKRLSLVLVPILAWGAAFYLIDDVATTIPWYDLAFGTNVAVVFWSLLFWALFSRKVPKIDSKVGVAIVGGAITATGSAVLYIATDRNDSVVIPAVIAAGSPLVTAVMAAALQHERLTTLKWTGAVVIVGAIAVTNL